MTCSRPRPAEKPKRSSLPKGLSPAQIGVCLAAWSVSALALEICRRLAG